LTTRDEQNCGLFEHSLVNYGDKNMLHFGLSAAIGAITILVSPDIVMGPSSRIAKEYLLVAYSSVPVRGESGIVRDTSRYGI
jgi:hypothetical protein